MTVFSFGAGQESICMLRKIIFDKDFREKHIKGELIVVGSDTGNEHDHTYAAVENCKTLCKELKIPFYWITPDMGFHPSTWQSLQGQYKRNGSIGSASFQQTCTDNLKVKVVNNFTEHWLKTTYGFEGGRKSAYYQFCEMFNTKIRLILGFAAGEEDRTKNGNKFDPVWKKKTVERHFPLIIEGIDRQQCITYNETYLSFKVWPSNCMMCFYQSDHEILWLYRNRPDVFEEWKILEAAKLEKYKNSEKNFGVYGKINLTEKLEKAQRLYGHWTNEELDEYKFSHGHCIKSKY